MATSQDEDFSAVILSFTQMIADPEIAHAVAAIKALTQVTKSSKAATIMGLEKELKTAADVLKETLKNAPFSLASGCELFTRFVTKTSLDIPDFTACKYKLIDRGDQFARKSQASRAKIAQLADRFVRDGAVVLTHGFSRVVQALLLHAAAQGKQFRVIVTEARPGDPTPTGYLTAKKLQSANIPVTVIMDSGVAHIMENVDVVLVGAEAIVENGGIVNKLGTYQISIVARACKKPFYVAAESFKFTRMYPLNQQDLPEGTSYDASPEPDADSSLQVAAPKIDYTPPSYITLLFTELGVLTPSAVSDELIKLYY